MFKFKLIINSSCYKVFIIFPFDKILVSNQFLYKARECFSRWKIAAHPGKFDTESVGSICVSCYPKFFSTRHIATFEGMRIETECGKLIDIIFFFVGTRREILPSPQGGLNRALKIELIYLEKLLASTWKKTTQCYLMRANGKGCKSDPGGGSLVAATLVVPAVDARFPYRFLIELIDTCDKECARHTVGNMPGGETKRGGQKKVQARV